MTTAHGDPAQFGPNAPGYAWRSAADVDPVELFPGVTIQPLWEGDNGAKALITTIAPGTVWPGEDHHRPGPEEVYVVSGVLNDGVNDYPGGHLPACPGGVLAHSPVRPGLRAFPLLPAGVMLDWSS